MYPFQWASITSILQGKDVAGVIVIGRTATHTGINADVASCLIEDEHLTCAGKSFLGTQLTTGSYVPFADKMIYAGASTLFPTISIVDIFTSNVRNFIYTSAMMSVIQLLHVRSPPNFIGGFIAGSCVSTTGVHYIYAGMVRSDTGVMTGMYIAPTSGSIRNSAELVNTMALEYENPDSFIAGGLQQSDDAGMQAYLVCVNSLYRKVIFSVRYVLRNTVHNARMLLEGNPSASSSVRGMVCVEKSLYLVVNREAVDTAGTRYSSSILRTDILSGNIHQQVHIQSHNASIQCTEITAAGLFLVIACAVQRPQNTTQSFVISVNRAFTFSKLPEGFTRVEENVFVAENIEFKGTVLPLTMSSDNMIPTAYTFTTEGGSSTLLPSIVSSERPSPQPSSAPSSQPSSSPTAAPSVSPQPTSQPSSSGPTNTYKPTVKPTQRPSSMPSKVPTVLPTVNPTMAPTSRPTVKPSVRPSTHPSIAPSTAPTHTITRRPTFTVTSKPSLRRSTTPTQMPSSATLAGERKANRDLSQPELIVGFIMGACLLLWCGYHVYNWNTARLIDVQKNWQAREFRMQGRRLLAEQPPHGFDLPGRLAMYKKIHGADYIDEMRTKLATDSLVRQKGSVDVKKPHVTKKNEKRGAYLDSVHEYNTQDNTVPFCWYMDGNVVSGAYANSAPMQGMHIDQSAFFGFATGNVNPPNSVCSDDSGSLELSSVHSSEMEEVEYSVHLNERSVEALHHALNLPASRSRENMIEEGGCEL